MNALLGRLNIGRTSVLRGSNQWCDVQWKLVMNRRPSEVIMVPRLFGIFANNLDDETRILSKSVEDVKSK